MRELLAALLLFGSLAILGAVAGGYLLARRALAPIDQMTLAAREISASRLNRRLDAPNESDELGRLASTFNQMFARLEQSFADMQHFTADAAHELRTPLTILRSEAEVALRAPRSAEDYRRSLESLLEEAERLTHLADQLLYLCREDAGIAKAEFAEIELDHLAGDVVGHMRAVAESKGVALQVGELSPCRMLGDSQRLRRLLFNLLDNAVKFTPQGGTVTIQLAKRDRCVELTVSDTGAGIPSEHLPHVFKRFYRADAARDGTGTGLGLAICRAIVESHDGTISATSERMAKGRPFSFVFRRHNEQWAIFSCRFPSRLGVLATWFHSPLVAWMQCTECAR